MGVLYYIQAEGDDDLFALNKAYHYLDVARLNYTEDFAPVPSRDAFFAEWMNDESRNLVEWGDRILNRLVAWAKGRPIRVVSEYTVDDHVHSTLTHEQHKAKITGSAHDSDYEPDGATYKTGSAW